MSNGCPSSGGANCYYWLEAGRSTGSPVYACHYCYITGKRRERDGDKCLSVLQKSNKRRVVRISLTKVAK